MRMSCYKYYDVTHHTSYGQVTRACKPDEQGKAPEQRELLYAGEENRGCLTMCGFSFYCPAIWTQENTGHEAKRAIPLSYNV